jgi:hypothetical protein
VHDYNRGIFVLPVTARVQFIPHLLIYQEALPFHPSGQPLAADACVIMGSKDGHVSSHLNAVPLAPGKW